MKAVVVAIASTGDPYDDLRCQFERHFAMHAPPCFDLVFLYASDAPPDERCDEKFVARCPELATDTLIPGVLQKTVCYLRQMPEGYDFVVRTNVSSWYHWDHLRRYLEACPRSGFAAGYSPDGSHLSGCNMVLSADVAALVAGADLETDVIDDVAISRELERRGISGRAVSRLDMVYDRTLEVHGPPGEAFHVRLKRYDRGEDVRTFGLLTLMYDGAARAADLVSRLTGADLVP